MARNSYKVTLLSLAIAIKNDYSRELVLNEPVS